MAKAYEIPQSKEERTTDEMRRMEVYNELVVSRRKRSILTGRITQCQINESASDLKMRVMAAVDYKGWKVIIPIGLMGLELDHLDADEYSKAQKESLYQRYLISMLGSTINFIVHQSENSINSAGRIVLGDRDAAMKKMQHEYYIKVNKASQKSKMERAFEAETLVKGRVVSTNKSSCFVEVYGKQVQILKKEMSWRFVSTVGDVVHNDDIVNLKILDLRVNHETEDIDLAVSIRAAQDNTIKRNMRNYKEKSTVMGIVSGIKDGYWIQVGNYENGIDIYCKKVNCLDSICEGDQVAVTIFSMNYETGQIFGSIENVIKRKNPFNYAA